MEITGRLTADTEVKTTKTGKDFAVFSIAINDSYKPKSGELKVITTYIKCSYWRSTKVAEWLRKGTLVQLSGRIGMNVYNNMDGNAVGSLTFNVAEIRALAFPARKNGAQSNSVGADQGAGFNGAASASTGNTYDDLPF